MPPATLAERLKAQQERWTAAGQSQVFAFLDKSSDDEKATLVADLESIDVAAVAQLYKEGVAQVSGDASAAAKMKPTMSPLDNVFRPSKHADGDKQLDEFARRGNALVADGRVAVLLLAGGQGTRLGSSSPKGQYDVGLPSHKSLFQVQAERLLRTQRVAAAHAGVDAATVVVPWLIMTSPATEAATRAFLAEHDYFGLRADQVSVFNQAVLPCLTPAGKVMLESRAHVACAPNGNGGIYAALNDSGALAELERRGVRFVAQYCVDNALVRMADPVFVGLADARDADCACKVVRKKSPDEAVGVLCQRNGKPGVVEYSEISPENAAARNDAGELVFGDSHICVNLFSVAFLRRIADEHLPSLWHHVAKKKIPYAHAESGEKTKTTEVNGWKFEKFIFDVFEFSRTMLGFEVERRDEFSPLKNAPGTAADSPDTCRVHVAEQHARWLRAAGATIVGPGDAGFTADGPLVEVSPLRSIAGENLEEFKGKEIKAPAHIE